jgi:hypothetical protein
MERQSDTGWSGGTLFQAVGGIIRGQAYGTYPTYFSNYGIILKLFHNLLNVLYFFLVTLIKKYPDIYPFSDFIVQKKIPKQILL